MTKSFSPRQLYHRAERAWLLSVVTNFTSAEVALISPLSSEGEERIHSCTNVGPENNKPFIFLNSECSSLLSNYTDHYHGKHTKKNLETHLSIITLHIYPDPFRGAYTPVLIQS